MLPLSKCIDPKNEAGRINSSLARLFRVKNECGWVGLKPLLSSMPRSCSESGFYTFPTHKNNS